MAGEEPEIRLDVSEITVDPAIKPLLRDAEERGWTPVKFIAGRGIRYWCPCPRRHNLWIDPGPPEDHYEDTIRRRLINKTCWEEDATP